MGEGSVDQVGEDGFDDGVSAVGDVGGRCRLEAVGEERVVAPDREQFVEPGPVADSAHDQPCGHGMAGRAERGEGGFGDLGIGDQVTGIRISITAPGYCTGVHASSGIVAMALVTDRFLTSTTENRTLAARQAPITTLLP